MRVQLEKLSLVDTRRTIEFRPGLNVIYGPISTGKTSVLRLCRIVLGAAVGALPREIKFVSAVSAKVLLGESHFEVVRPLSQSRTAIVDVAGDSVALRLPALQSVSGLPSYGNWLLQQLKLPRVEVPSAPTLPDSDPTPVSINDYLSYCDLPKEEIRSDVFGHRNTFKDIKRKYVFEILYGQYDVQVAELQDRLRAVRARLRDFEQEQAAFERLLQGTALENRAVLESELAGIRERVSQLTTSGREVAGSAPRDSQIAALKKRLHDLDDAIADDDRAVARERADVERFVRLEAQIETQISRLTRAVVANEKLLDIDFVVCPRCGAKVHRDRGEEEGTCYLCLQEPAASYRRSDLIAEQGRLAAQLEETRQLSAVRRRKAAAITQKLAESRAMRREVGRELDDAMQLFVSDSAVRLQEAAAERATLKEKERRLHDYLTLLDKRERAKVSLGKVATEEKELLARLEEAKTRREDVEQRIAELERRFTEMLQKLNLPAFLGTAEGRINRRTYLPSVNGRTFEELQSEGLAVEVNVAHALAHQVNALAFGLPLPNILLIDGVSGAFGERGYDPARVARIYEQLVDVCERANGSLQVIAVDTRVPDVARDSVVLELGEGDRLVPEDYVVQMSSAQQSGDTEG